MAGKKLTIFLGRYCSKVTVDYDHDNLRECSRVKGTAYPMSPFRSIVSKHKDLPLMQLPRDAACIDMPELNAFTQEPTGEHVRIIFADPLFNDGSELLKKMPRNTLELVQRLKAAEAEIDFYKEQFERVNDALGDNYRDADVKKAMHLLRTMKKAKNEVFTPQAGGYGGY